MSSIGLQASRAESARRPSSYFRADAIEQSSFKSQVVSKCDVEASDRARS